MGSSQAVWALRITSRDRYSDRCWGWGERLGISLDRAADRPGRRWKGVVTADASVRAERYRSVAAPQRYSFKHPLITPALSGTRDLPSARAATGLCCPYLHAMQTSSWGSR